MKKYVYSKGAEAVTVETDGLATINNFMVTGLIGKNYHGLRIGAIRSNPTGWSEFQNGRRSNYPDDAECC